MPKLTPINLCESCEDSPVSEDYLAEKTPVHLGRCNHTC